MPSSSQQSSVVNSGGSDGGARIEYVAAGNPAIKITGPVDEPPDERHTLLRIDEGDDNDNDDDDDDDATSKASNKCPSASTSSLRLNVPPPPLSGGPNTHRRRSLVANMTSARRRSSIMSKYSIEDFLANFPKTDAEFADRELANVIVDIMHSDLGLDSRMSRREQLRVLLHSDHYRLLLVALVIFDCLLVGTQIILDITSQSEVGHSSHLLHLFEKVVEGASVTVLSTFLILHALNAIMLPAHFLKSKLEMLDALLVVASLSLEVLSIVIAKEKWFEVAITTFRFWRILRIVSAVVITVEKRVYEKLDRLKQDIMNVVAENTNMELDLAKKDEELRRLRLSYKEKIDQLCEIQTQLKKVAVRLRQRPMLLQPPSPLARRAIAKSKTAAAAAKYSAVAAAATFV